MVSFIFLFVFYLVAKLQKNMQRYFFRAIRVFPWIICTQKGLSQSHLISKTPPSSLHLLYKQRGAGD